MRFWEIWQGKRLLATVKAENESQAVGKAIDQAKMGVGVEFPRLEAPVDFITLIHFGRVQPAPLSDQPLTRTLAGLSSQTKTRETKGGKRGMIKGRITIKIYPAAVGDGEDARELAVFAEFPKDSHDRLIERHKRDVRGGIFSNLSDMETDDIRDYAEKWRTWAEERGVPVRAG